MASALFVKAERKTAEPDKLNQTRCTRLYESLRLTATESDFDASQLRFGWLSRKRFPLSIGWESAFT